MKTNRALIVALAVSMLLAGLSAPLAQVTPTKYNGTGVPVITTRVLVYSTSKVATSANVYRWKSNGGTRRVDLDFSSASQTALDAADNVFVLRDQGVNGMRINGAPVAGAYGIQFETVDGNTWSFANTSNVERWNAKNSAGFIQLSSGPWRFNTQASTGYVIMDDNNHDILSAFGNHNGDGIWIQNLSQSRRGGCYLGGGTDIACGTFTASPFELVVGDADRVDYAYAEGSAVDHKDLGHNILWSEIDDGVGGHFAMTGTVKSTNLNADLLDGVDSTGFVTALHGVLSGYDGLALAAATSNVWASKWPSGAPSVSLDTCKFQSNAVGVGAGTCSIYLFDTTTTASCTVTYVCGAGLGVATQACTGGNAVTIAAGDALVIQENAPAANTTATGNLACDY